MNQNHVSIRNIIFICILTFCPIFHSMASGQLSKEYSRHSPYPTVCQELDLASKQLLNQLPAEELDWFFQDFGEELPQLFEMKDGTNFLPIIHSIVSQLPQITVEQKKQVKLADNGDFVQRMNVYLALCRNRRILRLNELITNSPRLVFLENKEFGNAPRLNMSMSDGPYNGKPFSAGAAIYTMEINAKGTVTVSPLLKNNEGMVRDLDVSFDGKRILFSQKENIYDDWGIYEMDLQTGTSRRISHDDGVADIQPCYLPDGILFHSTRCVTVVDCNESIDAVNIYRSDLDGKNIKRLTVDQVSSQFPSLLPDGRIIYTRWEYNDRGQIFPQALFTMYPDGSHQAAYYGNNSWYPTSLIQARGIPGSKKVLTIIAGHHTEPMGKLALINVGKGQEEGEGIQLVAPERKAEYKRVDKAEQDGELFQYPYPLSEKSYLVGYSLFGKSKSKHFGIYWMNKAGERELLAGDIKHVYRYPMPLAKRPMPRSFPSFVNHEKETGTFYVSNVYVGPGLKGVAPGTVKALRVIALDFRSSGIRTNTNKGVGGHARVTTPVSVGGAWDTKTILGDAKVYEDGSCYFEVPAHTPVYFQAIDQNGASVQSMRSWSTLMPGEYFSCIGCHESKSTAPVNTVGQSMALKAGPSTLESFYDVDEGFSYIQEIQPILDKHCIKCHQGESIRETIHLKNSGAPAFGLFTGYLANASVLTCNYQLSKANRLTSVELTWASKPPNKWELSYLKEGNWVKLSSSTVNCKDSIQLFNFPIIETSRFKLDVVPERGENQLCNFRVFDENNKEVLWGSPEKPFSLMGTPVDEPISGRRWSESYLRLIGAKFPESDRHTAFDAIPNELTNWISPQSEPTMLLPYQTGSSQSKLISMLEKGHKKVNMSKQEMDKLRTWIDLAVPFCGTYDEANIWSDEEITWFKRQNEKRKRLATKGEK